MLNGGIVDVLGCRVVALWGLWGCDVVEVYMCGVM